MYLKYLKEQVNNINNEPLRLVCNNFLQHPKLLECPGSSINNAKHYHHKFSGGLLLHLYQVVQGAIALANLEKLNIDIVIAGALLHDWGKLLVYYNRDTGHLEKHLPRGYAEFMIATKDWDESLQPLRIQVAHIILSHHGKIEHGSPIEPKTAEAYVVHLADVFSSRAMAGDDSINI